MQRDRARPDPVSCRSCRSKKLRCNRIQPCSNCTSRGITCNFLVPPRQADAAVPLYSNAELLSRIARLESMVLDKNGPIQNDSTQTSSNSQVTAQHLRPLNPESVISNRVHRMRDRDSQLLECIGVREDSLLSRLSNGLAFKISSLHELLETQGRQQPLNPLPDVDRSFDAIVEFPAFAIASLLFQSYESSVDYLCRILHIPTARSLMQTFYLRIIEGQNVLPGQAALLLSIFAIAAYFYRPFAGSEIAATRQQAIGLSKILSRGALDVLDYSRRNTSGALEDVQAYILMSLVTFHLDGFSARGRVLSTTAASVARELRLHRLDADYESKTGASEKSVCYLVDREVKRRVFWQIASTDWLFSTISGPQEGTYLIHPNHVNVEIPKDCADDEIALFGDKQPTARSQPTSMSFFLERLRLAHLCREMADSVPLDICKLIEMPYENIVALDEKMQDYLSNLPVFFKSDAESRESSRHLQTIYPHIIISRYCITVEAHSRRCKLHQKFLFRQSIDPRYAYSRRACLESARIVIQAYEDHRQFEILSTAPELMGIVVHLTHLALVVMVMDLCFNRDESEGADIKAEVKAALQAFEDARNLSPLLPRVLSSLSDVLRKHRVHLTDSSALENNNAAGLGHEMMLDSLDTNQLDDGTTLSPQVGPDMQDPGVSLDTSFDEFWQIAMQSETGLDSQTWDHLFSTFESRTL